MITVFPILIVGYYRPIFDLKICQIFSHSHHDARALRSIFCIYFSNFLINYMIKIISFLPNLSKRKNNRRLYLRKRLWTTTLTAYLTYFGEKNGIF